MRMFVALFPSVEAVAHLAAAVDSLRDGEDPCVRWIPPERWHITLAFLAQVDPGRVDRLQSSVAEIATQHTVLDGLHLSGAGAFGSTVWIGVAPTERGTSAERLAKAIQRQVRTCGIDIERRPWRAHLSIARVRTRDRATVKSLTADLVAGLAEYSGPMWTAANLTLVHSILGPQPEHIPVGTYPLSMGT